MPKVYLESSALKEMAVLSLQANLLLGILALIAHLPTATVGADQDSCFLGQENIEDEVNYTEGSDGVYIDVSHPSPCSGTVTSIKGCVSLSSIPSPQLTILNVLLYRNDTSSNLSHVMQINRAAINFNATGNVTCFDHREMFWDVQRGDYLGVCVMNNCSRSYSNPIFSLTSSNASQNWTVLYTSVLEESVPYSEVSILPVALNIQATISPATATKPPDSEPSCPPSIKPSKEPESEPSIGSVERNPDQNSFIQDKGGTYIINEQSSVSGRVTSIELCGMLNTNDTEVTEIVFKLQRFRLQFTIIDVVGTVNIDLFNHSNTYRTERTGSYCSVIDYIDLPVDKGDMFAISIGDDCINETCPLHIFVRSCESNLLYINQDDIGGLDLKSDLQTLPSRANIRFNITEGAATMVEATTGATDNGTTEVPWPLTTMGITIITISIAIVLVVVFCVVASLMALCIRKKKSRTKNKVNSTKERGNSQVLPTTQIEVNGRGILRRNPSQYSISPPTHPQDRRVLSNVYDIEEVHSTSHEYAVLEEPLTDYQPYQAANYQPYQAADYQSYQAAEYEIPLMSPASKEVKLKLQLSKLGIKEVPVHQLEFEMELGRGQFGRVYKALWRYKNDKRRSKIRHITAHVAVKVMEDVYSVENRIRFLQEAVLMGQFNDPNIVAVFGVTTTSSRLMMICELMDEDLKKHLSTIRTGLQGGRDVGISSSQLPALLLSYCRKIASSFVYLGLKGFVHRDLAARNILVSSEGDCKIADFGMSHDLQENSYYKSHGGVLPVKWTAPEAIMYRKFSTKSDVWSYGILLYEIWSLGCKPYGDLSNQEVIIKVEAGYRLPPPPGCPRTIYDLMIKCTHPEEESRPTFTSILVSLQRPDYQLLKWSPDDVATSSEAARALGAPLDEGQCLYKDIQNTYLRDGISENSV